MITLAQNRHHRHCQHRSSYHHCHICSKYFYVTKKNSIFEYIFIINRIYGIWGRGTIRSGARISYYIFKDPLLPDEYGASRTKYQRIYISALPALLLPATCHQEHRISYIISHDHASLSYNTKTAKTA